jgi:hypothetical protein
VRTSSSPSYFYVSIERRPWIEEQPVFRFLPVPTLSILHHRRGRGILDESRRRHRLAPNQMAGAGRHRASLTQRHTTTDHDGTIGKDDGQHTPTPMID